MGSRLDSHILVKVEANTEYAEGTASDGPIWEEGWCSQTSNVRPFFNLKEVPRKGQLERRMGPFRACHCCQLVVFV